jgi:hypothetical protein
VTEQSDSQLLPQGVMKIDIKGRGGRWGGGNAELVPSCRVLNKSFAHKGPLFNPFHADFHLAQIPFFLSAYV